MPWSNSARRAQLPSGWARIRRRVLERDGYRCTWLVEWQRCSKAATDVDHVRDPHDHRESNLRSLCAYHHARKSAAEGVAARRARGAVGYQSSKRTPELHPGVKR
jgi:hypothetical protein